MLCCVVMQCRDCGALGGLVRRGSDVAIAMSAIECGLEGKLEGALGGEL